MRWIWACGLLAAGGAVFGFWSGESLEGSPALEPGGPAHLEFSAGSVPPAAELPSLSISPGSRPGHLRETFPQTRERIARGLVRETQERRGPRELEDRVLRFTLPELVPFSDVVVDVFERNGRLRAGGSLAQSDADVREGHLPGVILGARHLVPVASAEARFELHFAARPDEALILRVVTYQLSEDPPEVTFTQRPVGSSDPSDLGTLPPPTSFSGWVLPGPSEQVTWNFRWGDDSPDLRISMFVPGRGRTRFAVRGLPVGPLTFSGSGSSAAPHTGGSWLVPATESWFLEEVGGVGIEERFDPTVGARRFLPRSLSRDELRDVQLEFLASRERRHRARNQQRNGGWPPGPPPR